MIEGAKRERESQPERVIEPIREPGTKEPEPEREREVEKPEREKVPVGA